MPDTMPDIQSTLLDLCPGPALSLMGHTTTWQFIAKVLSYRCSHGWNIWGFPSFALPSRTLHSISILCVKFFSCFYSFQTTLRDRTEMQSGDFVLQLELENFEKLYILRQSVRKRNETFISLCSARFGMETSETLHMHV